MTEEKCCDEGTCEYCDITKHSLFVTTFYFDNHAVTIHGCAEAVGILEAQLNISMKDRIPKKEETFG